MKILTILFVALLTISCSSAPKVEYIKVFIHPEKGRQLSTPAVKHLVSRNIADRRQAQTELESSRNKNYVADLEYCNNLMYEKGIRVDGKVLTGKQAIYSFLYEADILNGRSIVRKGLGLNSGLTRSQRKTVKMYKAYISDRWLCMEGLGWEKILEEVPIL